MDVIEIVRSVFRRWYVVVPVLLVTAGLAYYVVSTSEATYQTAGSFLLTDAALLGEQSESGVRSSVTPAVLAEVVQDDASRQRIADEGGTAVYTVDVGGDDGILRVRATGDGEAAAVNTVNAVIAELQRVMDERQDRDDVPEGLRVDAEVLATPATARRELVEVDGAEELQARFVSTGSLRLLGATGQGANPYAGSLSGTVRVLEEVMASPQTRSEILEQGGSTVFSVGMRSRDSAPIVYVTADASSPERSVQTFGLVVERLRTELLQRQERAGAAPSTMLAFEPLAIPSAASLVGGELRRPLIVIVALGLVAAVSLAVLVEGLASRTRRGSPLWSRRREDEATAEDAEQGGEEQMIPPEPARR